MAMNDLEKLFAKASRLENKGDDGPPDWEFLKIIDGAKKFKRRILGLCGTSAVKSLDEVAYALYKTGIASSVEEGKEIVPSLINGGVNYSFTRGIRFTEVTKDGGQKAYRIATYATDEDRRA